MTDPRKRFVLLRDTAVVLTINTAVALGIALFTLVTVQQFDTALRIRVIVNNLIFSHAIGLAVFGLVEWVRLTHWWQRPPGWAPLALVMALAVPSGYLIGGAIASALTAAPFELLLQFGPAALFTGAATIATSVFAVHFITQRERLAEERHRAERADGLAQSARLQLLQQQIEPHMLFNTLANVHALIDEEPERAQEMLEALSELLHTSMQLNEQPLISLQQEFALLRHYLRLMSIRLGPRLRCTLTLPPELEQVGVPPLAVQPLVENAVKHGLEPKLGGGSIIVAARADGDSIVVEVIDDGLGLAEDEPASIGRIGLVNIRKRLAYAFGERAGLTLRNNHPTGVIATLTIPR